MKTKLQKLLIAIAGLLVSTNAFANSEFWYKGLYYYVIDSDTRTVAVTHYNYDSNYYKGNIIIPPKVIGGGITYSVTEIGLYAFHACTGLTSVTIPNSVTTIGTHAFANCRNLTSVTIPSSVTSIGVTAFYECDGLTSITIPNSVTSIGGGAFNDCDGLTSIVVESENTAYDSRDNCNAIIETASNTLIKGCKNTTIPNSVTSIGDAAFYNCDGLTSITIPNSVTSIGDNAFNDCDSLTSVTIPNSVTTIGEYAFRNCDGLTSVTIGSSVTSIGDYAFGFCYGLQTIYCQSTTPPSAPNGVFSDYALEYAILYVPLGTKSAYESVDPWRNFWNIEEMDFNGVEDIAIDESEELSVSVDGGKIIVNNALNCNVVVYTLAGQQVYSNNAYNGESISISKGVYIVKSSDKTIKVII